MRLDIAILFLLLLISLPKKRAASTSWFDLSWRSGISEIDHIRILSIGLELACNGG